MASLPNLRAPKRYFSIWKLFTIGGWEGSSQKPNEKGAIEAEGEMEGGGKKVRKILMKEGGREVRKQIREGRMERNG